MEQDMPGAAAPGELPGELSNSEQQTKSEKNFRIVLSHITKHSVTLKEK